MELSALERIAGLSQFRSRVVFMVAIAITGCSQWFPTSYAGLGMVIDMVRECEEIGCLDFRIMAGVCRGTGTEHGHQHAGLPHLKREL